MKRFLLLVIFTPLSFLFCSYTTLESEYQVALSQEFYNIKRLLKGLVFRSRFGTAQSIYIKSRVPLLVLTAASEDAFSSKKKLSEFIKEVAITEQLDAEPSLAVLKLHPFATFFYAFTNKLLLERRAVLAPDSGRIFYRVRLSNDVPCLFLFSFSVDAPVSRELVGEDDLWTFFDRSKEDAHSTTQYVHAFCTAPVCVLQEEFRWFYWYFFLLLTAAIFLCGFVAKILVHSLSLQFETIVYLFYFAFLFAGTGCKLLELYTNRNRWDVFVPAKNSKEFALTLLATLSFAIARKSTLKFYQQNLFKSFLFSFLLICTVPALLRLLSSFSMVCLKIEALVSAFGRSFINLTVTFYGVKLVLFVNKSEGADRTFILLKFLFSCLGFMINFSVVLVLGDTLDFGEDFLKKRESYEFWYFVLYSIFGAILLAEPVKRRRISLSVERERRNTEFERNRKKILK